MNFSTKNDRNMDKIHRNSLAAALCAAFLFLMSFSSFGQNIIYSCDFEDETENSNWTFANCDYYNGWYIGTAAYNGGSKGLYISNDYGTSNLADYDDTYVYAYREINATETDQYLIVFDWRAVGATPDENSGEGYCLLRSFLVPTTLSSNLNDCDYNGMSYDNNTTPSGWIDVSSSENGLMYGQSSWQHSAKVINLDAGTYYLVFFWKNNSDNIDPPAAVDNISISKVVNPAVATSAVSNLGATFATLNGEILSQGASDVIARGFEYGTDSENLSNTLQSADNTDAFSSELTGLAPNTTYYYRAYATNSNGTGYGAVKSFKTLDTFNGHVYVDLGLESGTLWATTNVGANSPEEYGNYYAWGETSSKETYSWSNYAHCNGESNSLTKYCDDASYGYNGYTDDLYYLESTDDAATANWGTGWQMPTYDELEELNDYCTVTWTTRNGVNGRLYTGPNGNSIFLPAAGDRDNDNLESAGSVGCYWSSSRQYAYNAWYLNFYSGNSGCDYDSRHYGYSVRPVLKASPTVETKSATDVEFTTATLQGKILFAEDATVTNRGFLFGTDSEDLAQNFTSNNSTDNFTYSVSDLTANTTYYFKAYATINSETKYGEIKSFTTTNASQVNPEYVDLGLPSGIKWANMNIGATQPSDFGNRYAWGETTPKDVNSYSWENYIHCAGTNNDLTKYCFSSIWGHNGYTDELTTLEATDDAATVNWGEGWRMPTDEECQELYNNCYASWDTQNGVVGVTLTSRSNGNSIFIPIDPEENNGTHYWSSSFGTDDDDPTMGKTLYLNASNQIVSSGGDQRNRPNAIRPVYVQSNTANNNNNTFTDDRDGQTYKFVTIGNQIWMAENLRYNNNLTVDTEGETSDTDPYLYYPNGESGNLETYGYLYNWPAAMNSESSSESNPSGVQGICPDGWHLPSNAEWTQLYQALGGETNAGAMLSGNVSLWSNPTITESQYFGNSGFNALPAGYYESNDYGNFGNKAFFWSTSEYDTESAYICYIGGEEVGNMGYGESAGLSVRCVKDGGNTANNNTNENSGDIIYQSDFENSGEWNEWTLNNGDQTNKWTIGLGNGDASSTETNSLYITNDNSSYNYNNGAASAVYAYKEIELSSTSNYHILFDWKCIGEESWDYLRAFIIPASENPNLSAGNVIGDGYEDANTTPDGWIDLYDGEMSGSDNQWRNAESTVALSAGNYYLVFYWRNDESAGSNPPAAVDNIFIYKLMPISVTTNVSDRTSTSVTLNGTITFAGEPENIAAGFKWGDSETSLPNNITTQSTGATFSEQLTGLTQQTTYYYQAYAVYDGDTAFSEITQFRTALDESSAGGANNPLLIGDISDWQDFSNALQNPSTVTYKGVMLADYGLDMYFSLESDLSFTEAGVAFSIDNFKGNLNGNYNTITIQPDQTFTGLFANFSDGHIDNLNLRMNSSATLEGAGDFGVLCQNAYQAYISNCTVSGISSEELSSSDDGHHIGGLVGYAMQTTISGCTNNLKIVSGGAKVGGIVGKADGTIMYCINNAELSGAYVGGIMAEGAATITNCLNTGRINCSDEYAGGISGTGGTIVGCMNIGEISATGTQRAGGIVGSAESTTTVTNCANYGVFPTFSSPMGGIAGSGNGTYSHNVSAPLCRSTEQAIYSLNEIYATVATEESEYNSASETDDFFDEQVGDIKVDSLRLRYAERGTPKTTTEITGSALSTSLSSENWDFTDGIYPKPKNITETSQTIAARIPIYLGPHQSVFGVWENFSLPTLIDGQPVTWDSDDSAISISGSTATVTRPASGEDDIDVQITADYGGYTKTFVVRVIAPKHIPVYTGDASQDSVINLTGEFDNDTEGTTYAYDYGFQYSTTSADLSENVTTVQSTNLNHTFFDGRAFSYPLANIPEGTMVYYRAYATTADGTELGDILNYKSLGAPVVVAKYPLWRTDNSAEIELDITLNDGEDLIELENAFYYGTERNNLSSSDIIDYNDDYGYYFASLSNLTPNTKYYYVAEVTNDYGTTRSDTLEFRTYGIMTDSRNTIQYYTIQIGDQTWMAQNLKYAGDEVSLGTMSSETEPYYYYVNGDEANTSEYGYLYNWKAAMNGASSSTEKPSGVQGICPPGWHLPSHAEWTQLTDYLGGTENAGAVLAGQPLEQNQYWPSGNLTQSETFGASGFGALPAGYYFSNYIDYGTDAYFWSATENNSSNALNRRVVFTFADLNWSDYNKDYGFSIRCLKGTAIYAYDTINECMEEPYSYTYHDTTITTSGDYTIRRQIDGDTENIYKLHIAFHPTLTANISEFSNGCFGANNGYVEVGATGGAGTYTYNWNTPEAQTTARVNNLGAGEYAVTVTDAARCTATISQTLTAPEELTASINGNNPNCFGDATTLTANASGGTPDYTYVWSSGESTSSITVSPTATTTYTVTVTDANNCTATAFKNVVVNSQLTVSISGDTQVQCFGDNTATLTASASGGSMATGYTYNWSNSLEGQTISTLGAGTYSVTVTDGNGCTASANATVTGPTAALSASISATNTTLTCSNLSSTLTATPTGGTEDYTYSWSNSGSNNTTEVTTPGSYIVEVTDANGCTAEATQAITQDITAPTVTIDNTETELNCNRTSIALTATGNGASYVWSNGETNAATTVTTPDTYTVTATGSNGCTNETSVVITKVENPTVEVTAGEILCNGATTTFTANVSNGRAPYTFRWQDNSTEQTLNAQAGTYNVTITDSNGCTASTSTTVNVNDQTVPELTGTWPSNITGQNNCFANADISELLSNDAVEALYEDCSGITVSHTDANTSTDNCGWTITRTYTIQDPYGNTVEPNPTMSVSGSDQSAPELSGTWPANITGQDNCFANADISGLISDDDVADLYSDGCGGTVTVSHSDASTLTDNCGWTITRTYTIRDACGNETTNTMSVSGSDQSEPALAGTWPDNITGQDNCFANADLSGLISDDEAAAQYIDGCGGSVTVSHSDANTLTDNCGWTITRTYTITNACGTNSTTITQSVSGSDQSAPTLSGTWPANITAQNNCFADADVSGLMSDDDVSELYSDGCGGTISVTHTDANTTTDNCGWTITRTYTISDVCGNEVTKTQSVSGSDETAPTIGDDNLDRQLTSTNCVFTVPDLTGEVRNIASDNCTANGNLAVSQNITAGTEITTATTVVVTVTDQCGNNSTKEIELTLPDELTTSLSANPATIACNGGTTSITNTPDGGTAPYQYFWSNSTNEQNLASVTAGTYTVTVRDNNGCSVVESLEITQPNALSTSLSATSILCNGQTSNITNTVAGGTPNYTYNWNNGSSTQNLEGVGGGTYSVTVTDANNCIATATITVNEPEELTSELSAGTIACNGSTTDITNTVSGGTTPITYEWNNGANTQNLTGVVAGTYSVTVRDNNSCSVVREITITQPNVLAVSVDAGSVACNGSTTTASAVVSGGTEPYEYQWSNSATTQTITDIIAGTYSVTVTDDNGCSTNAFTTITQPEELTVSISGPTSVCQNTTSTLTANVQGGTADFTYSWSNSATTSSITTPQLTTATEYSVTVTDANNCSASASVNVEIGDTPGITIADVTPICVGGNTMLQANVSNAGTGYTVEWSSTDTGAGLPADITTDAITVAPTSAGTYTYTVSLTATSCSDGQPFTSSDNVQLLVNGLPDAAITNNTNETTITCSTTQISLTATGGTAYQWSNGGAIADNNITSADTYTVTVTDANGCSNTESIVITEDVAAPTVNIINETGTTLLTCTTTTINVEATGTGSSYLWSNEVTTATNAITTGGTYTVTATADNGCTSTAAIEITPNADAPTVSITNNSDTTVLTCSLTSINVTATGSGTSYEWSNGANTAENTLTAPGTYTVTATAGNGCSASEQITITQDIAAPEIIASTTDSTICQGASTTISATGGNSYTWSPETGLPSTVGASLTATPDTTRTYTVTGVGTNGCTGTAEVTITVNQPTSSEFTTTACDLYTWNGTNYTESGDFQQTLVNANGCDSVVTLHLTINNSQTNTDEVSACDSYEWAGEIYTASGTYEHTFQAVNGCDSVVTLHLTINTPTESNDTVTVCDSYEWNGTTYTETGNYQITLPNANANGCDSIANLFLTINHTVTGIDRQEACESFTWLDGVTYTESTDSTDAPTFTLQNAEGCDSVVSLYLVVNYSTTSEVSAQMCSGVPYTYEGETFTEAGTYTVTLTNSHGCDSVVTLTLTYANNCGGIVSGIVTDENNGEPIYNARVTVGNRVTRTNSEGEYSIEVLRGRKALRVSATGYISYSNMVDIQSDTAFNISLNAPHIETDVDSLTVSSYPYLEQSDSITLSNTGNGTLVWSSITEYDNIALVEDSVIQQRSNTRSLWDSIQTFATHENAEQAIATDGFFIYTSSWMRPGEFNRYTPNGEYVETFYVENVGSIRNLSYDGTHFYGTEGTNIIFKLDLDNQTLVDSIETDIQEIRHCSFNKQDGSLLAGSWNSLYRIDIENGTSEQIRNDLANVYSSAFDNLSPGGPYLWLFSQTSQNNGPSAYIRQFNISTGEYTSKTHYLDDINLTNSSLAGGICASEYICEGKFVLLADVQNPMGSNTIATYEIGRTNNVVRTGKKSGSIAPNSSENISVKASATETGDYSATIKYRAAVMGAYSRDIDVNISAVAPECDAVQQISIVTDTFHTVTLDWQPVELGNYESVSYLVFNTASQYAIDTVSGTTITYDGLSVGEHCFSVMALSQAGYTCLSAASDTVCAEIQDIPCNIPLAVEARSDGESIFLTWNKPVGVEYFRVHRNDEAEDIVLYDDNYTDSNVVPEIEYCYTITAYFEDGICNELVATACSKIVSGLCADAPVLYVEAFGGSIALSWTGNGDSYSYRIFRNNLPIGLTTDTTYYDNVARGFEYCYKVESLCEYGMFVYSDEECIFIEEASDEEDENAIEEWTADNLTVYPNPTYGQFFIEGPRIATVMIYNASGQLVAEIDNTESERISIDCSGWNPGLYNIRIISTEGQAATRKVSVFR